MSDPTVMIENASSRLNISTIPDRLAVKFVSLHNAAGLNQQRKVNSRETGHTTCVEGFWQRHW